MTAVYEFLQYLTDFGFAVADVFGDSINFIYDYGAFLLDMVQALHLPPEIVALFNLMLSLGIFKVVRRG